MAAFDPGDDADEMPDIKWVDGFKRSADEAWWSKGDHVGLGKDLVRSSLRALVPDLPTPSEGDQGLANNMVDGCIWVCSVLYLWDVAPFCRELCVLTERVTKRGRVSMTALLKAVRVNCASSGDTTTFVCTAFVHVFGSAS